MSVYNSLNEIHISDVPVVLTIGNFDGVHLGHQKVIEKIVSEAKKLSGKSAVITFRNHPSEIFSPQNPIKLMCTPEEKAKILKLMGVDYIILQPFTKAFAEQDVEQFLRNVQKRISFVKLILGYDAKIGKERKGDREKVMELSQSMGFSVEYLSPLLVDGAPVSSSRIRKAISEGNVSEAEKLLGRAI